uniref:Uncharacterized protein n=1 Tax=Rhizophora mucronata TaxID=61149 RepID=A0A2P2JJY1_RHIMU
MGEYAKLYAYFLVIENYLVSCRLCSAFCCSFWLKPSEIIILFFIINNDKFLKFLPFLLLKFYFFLWVYKGCYANKMKRHNSGFLVQATETGIRS